MLPTGAGKTAIGAVAIARTGERTLIVVPTLDLLRQWTDAISHDTGAPEEVMKVGFPADDTGHQLTLFPWEPPDILVATYAGTSRNLDHLHHFSLIIFDEVHHLPAEVHRKIAECASASARLGLTATPERYDQAHTDLDTLVGPTVYRQEVQDLGSYLAPHEITRILVDLTPDERAAYDLGWHDYISYVRRAHLRMPQGFQQLIKRAGRDGGAKKALEGHRTAREIALSARAKTEAVENLLSKHRGDKVLIFCQHVEMAQRLGHSLGLPVATHETPRASRGELLRQFKSGESPVVIATSILDEGVDVPDARVGIVVSGTGQPRQFIQRLGRIVRPGEGKQALLYELVSRNTLEENTARRRHKNSGKNAPLPSQSGT